MAVMSRTVSSACFFCCFLVVGGVCLGGTVYVDVNGPNDPGSGSAIDPFRRIGLGIGAAVAGDVVEVRPGTYTGSGNRDLDFSVGLAGGQTRTITVQGSDPNDAEVVSATVIDCGGTGSEPHRGFYFHSGEDANCVVSGLTIRNAYGPGVGGAIYCENAGATVRNCVVTNSQAMEEGGGVGCSGGEVVLENCIIGSNHGGYGGGVGCLNEGSAVVMNCTIVNNTADFLGGGVYCFNGGQAEVENSVIWGNSLVYGQDANGYQVGLEYASVASIAYSDVEGGQARVVNVESTLEWSAGTNIDADPCFVSLGPGLWDVRLQSEYGRWDSGAGQWVTDAKTSGCIDMGDPNADYGGEPWPNGKRINMGAYGGTSQASMNGNRADFDVSGVVDLKDLLELASKWQMEGAGIVNLDGQGSVDLSDFAIFSENWQWQRD